MIFKNFSEIYPYLRTVVNDALENEVEKEVIKIQQSWILREVYLAYRPKRYERRGNEGGLIDAENIVGIMNRATSTLTVVNETKRSKNYTQEYLAPLIEYGHKEAIKRGIHGYDYVRNPLHYHYMRPRPFTEKTREDLRNNKLHVQALKRGLKRQGINFT